MSALRIALACLFAAFCFSAVCRADDSPCVSSVPELVVAMASFDLQPDGSTLSIRLVQGTYAVGAALGHSLFNSKTVSVELLGGYTAGCAGRKIDPANTIIDGLDLDESGFAFVLSHDANALLEGLTFTRMHSLFDPSAVVSLEHEVGQDDSGSYAVRYCRFLANTGDSVLLMSGPVMVVESSLFAGNDAMSSIGAVADTQMDYHANSEVIFTNNTLANNIGTALQIDEETQTSDRTSDVSDNIFWANTRDFSLTNVDAGDVFLLESYDIVSTISGLPPASSDLAVDPRFNPGLDNYTLAPDSPAINSGDPFPLFGWPPFDAAGNPRIVGSRVDRGGYESNADDRTGALVTTAADNGDNTHPLAGSLRAAIKAGNAAAGPFRISFAIDGGCSQILELAAPMLDITGNVTIDGTSQPGWTPNTSRDVFNANLCILLNGAGDASTPWALHVPSGAPANARLTVQGLLFAGFSDAAVKLEGGAEHRLFGNQFGAIGFTAPNHQAIRVTGESTGAFIGDYANAAAVNLIAGSTDPGIYLDNAAGGSTIASNLIGFQIDGSSNGGNDTGVFIFNSPNNNLQLNVIGYSASSGVEIAGVSATGNVLQSNTIGVNRAGSSASNNADGVRVDLGAGNTTIGAPQDSDYGGNVIGDNGGPGVWLTVTAGNGNRVLDNAFHDNSGLDIDLAAAGPTSNQSSSPGTGPNRLQNYPQLAHALYASNGHQLIDGQLNSAANASYRIDVYYGAACGASGRGLAQVHLGHASVLTNAAGVVNFTLDLPPGSHPGIAGTITATATDSAGDTSEIGDCTVEEIDSIFADSFDS